MIKNKTVRAVGETTISSLPAALKMLQTMLVPVDTKDSVTQRVTTERVSLSDILKLFEAIGTLPPVGMPQLWATPNIPVGYLELNGESFDMELYPELAIVYPSGKLPDWRGRVPKCTPSGGVIGSFEEDAVGVHDHVVTVSDTDLGDKNTKEGGGHTHPMGIGAEVGSGTSAMVAKDKTVSGSIVREGGTHHHGIALGAHKHEAQCSKVGAVETRVKSVFVTFIVRAR